MIKRTAKAIAVVALSMSLGCTAKQNPVGRLSTDGSQLGLAYPGLTSVHLQFSPSSPLGELEGSPLVFVHLLDEPGSVVRTFDHPLPGEWQPGVDLDYEVWLYQSAIAPPLPAGVYDLSVGVYDRSGRRWPLETSSAEIDDGEYVVASVTVDETAADVPMFYFSPSWLPLEAGTDLQILSRRWLTGEGTIRVAEIPSAGSVGVRVRIPDPEPGTEELATVDGETEPTVIVNGSCAGEVLTIRGSGLHEVKIAVRGDEQGRLAEECEILLQPNFHIVELNTLARRSMSLEVLTWSGE